MKALPPRGRMDGSIISASFYLHAAEDLNRGRPAIRGVALQLQSAKQLTFAATTMVERLIAPRRHSWGDRIPANEKAASDGDSDQVVCGRPNKILDHLFVGSP